MYFEQGDELGENLSSFVGEIQHAQSSDSYSSFNGMKSARPHPLCCPVRGSGKRQAAFFSFFAVLAVSSPQVSNMLTAQSSSPTPAERGCSCGDCIRALGTLPGLKVLLRTCPFVSKKKSSFFSLVPPEEEINF